ncbi:MAG: AraC family ligand binding domain-containing protein, partial [Prevotella sp.]|nr:AraC family ligand binding domain-containing protein [Prevotella sp.]
MIKKKDGFQGEQTVVLPPVLIEMEEHDELCQSLYITDIGYYPKAEHHQRTREKAISQYVLIYCVEGDGWYQVDGQQHEVTKNQYFILPARKPHAYGTQYSWTIYWVHFAG